MSTGCRDWTEWLLSWYGQTCKLWLLTSAPSHVRGDIAIFTGAGAITPFPWIGIYLSMRNSQRSRNSRRLQSLLASQNPGILQYTADLSRFSASGGTNEFTECHRGHWLNSSDTIRHRDNPVPIVTRAVMSFSLMKRRFHLLCQCL